MRHKHADLIIAWANDFSIQLQVKNSDGNWEDIHKTPAWYENTEYRIKPETWEPRQGSHHINGAGIVEYGSNKAIEAFGMSRLTRVAAAQAAIEMRVYHRLLAYRDEFCSGYKASIQDRGYYIYRNRNGNGNYGTGDHHGFTAPGVVYFPREVAMELARKLNEGEVVL